MKKIQLSNTTDTEMVVMFKPIGDIFNLPTNENLQLSVFDEEAGADGCSLNIAMGVLNVVSEEFRKYLIEVVYERFHYFTVWGTDMVDRDLDKWLADKTGRMMLFANLPSLQNNLNTDSYFFDNENIRRWINHSNWQSTPDSLSNFDLLLQDDLNYRHPSLIDLYDLIGVLEDFAIQRGDKEMISVFRSDLFMQFKDKAADAFLWEGEDEFDSTFDFRSLNRECCKIHRDLKGKILIIK